MKYHKVDRSTHINTNRRRNTQASAYKGMFGHIHKS